MVERSRSRRTTSTAPHRGLRTCVGCRKRDDRSQLLRVAAVGQDGSFAVVPNERGKLPGRGAWLHRTQDCLQEAVRRRGLHRALIREARGTRLDVQAVQQVMPAPSIE